MAFELSDVFIGSFPVTQNFGARPEVYSARYNLKGHNGIDFGCPTNTPVLATADGFVMEMGFDSGGYGNYIKVVHNGFLSLYGHLNDIQVKQNDIVTKGQLIGHSNNTGFSDAPHLHFGIAPCDAKGNKTEPDNGYSGYIDPQGPLCHWNIKNPAAPTLPEKTLLVPVADFERAVAQGTQFKDIVQYSLSQGVNQFLQAHNVAPLDLVVNPNDPDGGDKITLWIAGLLANQKTPDMGSVISGLNVQEKDNLLQSIYNALKGVIFTHA